MSRMRLKFIAVIVLAAAMSAVTIAHVHGVNGPWYWRWAWRRLEWLRLYPAMALAAAPFFWGQYLFWKNPRRKMRALALMTLAMTLSNFATGIALDRLAWSPRFLFTVLGAYCFVPGTLWLLAQRSHRLALRERD